LSALDSSSAREERVPLLIREFILLSELAVRALDRSSPSSESFFFSSFADVCVDSFLFSTGAEGEVIEGDETDGIEGILI